MRSTALLLFATACWTPKETSPTGMVGHLLDAEGAPIQGATVESLEARFTTDEQGHFAGSYKAPTQYVFVSRDGVWVERHYRPEDDKVDVELRLPALASRTFACEIDEPCEARLVWETAPGTKAIVRGKCDPEVQTVRFTAPATGKPTEAWCRNAPDQPETRLGIRDSGNYLRLTLPPVPLTVRLQTDAPQLPQRCSLTADGVPVENSGEGSWVASTFGRTQLLAQCDGIYASPKMLIVRGPAEVTMNWSPVTPTLDLRAEVPLAQRVLLTQIMGRNNGWSLSLDARPDGTFVLPRMSPGTYFVGVDTTLDQLISIKPAADLEPGTLHITDLPDGGPVSNRAPTVGVLIVEQDLRDGSIPVIRYRDEEVSIPAPKELSIPAPKPAPGPAPQ